MSKKTKGEGMQKVARFFKKQGYLILIGICVLLISAVIILAVIAATKPQQPIDQPTGGGNEQPSDPTGGNPDDPDPVVSEMKFVAPIDGTLVDNYGKVIHKAGGKGEHVGVDYTAKAGTAVKASYTGVVKAAKQIKGEWFVQIEYTNGYIAEYRGISDVSLTANASIKQGDTIGKISETPYNCGDCANTPHLHFVVRKVGLSVGGGYVDPLSVIVSENK